MVKLAPSSQRTSSTRSPPSLPSTSLKPCKASLFFSSFLELKRPLLVHAQSMDPSSSASSSAGTDSLDHANSMDNASFPQVLDRHQTRKSAEAPSCTEEGAASREENMGSMCGRQRLQQHRIQMGGKVIIPEAWGREQQLQEWVSYGIVEDALRPAGVMSARSALVRDCQRREKKPVRTPPPMSADVEVS